jgi:hypothetical protein
MTTTSREMPTVYTRSHTFTSSVAARGQVWRMRKPTATGRKTVGTSTRKTVRALTVRSVGCTMLRSRVQ